MPSLDLSLMRRRADELHVRVVEGLSGPHLSTVEKRLGPDGVLNERCNGWFLASRSLFRAGSFAEAARCFRLWHEAMDEYASWHAAQGDVEGARTLRQERARHAWAVDLDLFRRYVLEGCEPGGGVTPSLDALAALFLAWAVLRERFHDEHWTAAWLAAEEEERESVRRSYRGDEAAQAVATAVLIETRLARGWYWLGNGARAASAARVASMGFADWPSVRPAGLLLRSKRAWRRRSEGLARLAEASSPADHVEASALFARALSAAADTRSQDWKDLVLLHLRARAGANANDPFVAEFRAAFPHVEHLATP